MRNWAYRHAASCFLNSLLREWSGYRIASSFSDGVVQLKKHIVIEISSDEELLIPLVKESRVGRHQYADRFYLRDGAAVHEIGYEDLVFRLCDDLATAFKTDKKAVQVFKERVLASLHNTEASLKESAKALQSLFKPSLNFLAAEQGLMVGHNFHPTPKSRDEFSDDDLRIYAPEFGGRFYLSWFMVDPEILHDRRADSFEKASWSRDLAFEDLSGHQELESLLEKGFVPYPVHPWQKGVLLEKPLIQRYLRTNRLVFIGDSHSLWYPTSSLRSIYREESAYMLKFSMSVKLTNSVRHLLIHEVERGLQMGDVLQTKEGQEFLKAHPDFSVVTEPAYMALKDEDGKPLAETVIVCRHNPFHKETAKGQAVLATLTQDAPLGGENLIQKLVRSRSEEKSLTLHEAAQEWFHSYLEIVVRPLIHAQANYGIVMGAHQQNLILKIKNGLPVAASFRDCQGTGYSELGYSLFAHQVASITRDNGNVLSEKMAHSLFAYYLILNSTFNVITALASDDWISETELILTLREFLEGLRDEDVRDPSFIDYLLNSDTLMHKGNFICSFRSINENTTADPLIIYTPVENVLKSYQPERKVYGHAESL